MKRFMNVRLSGLKRVITGLAIWAVGASAVLAADGAAAHVIIIGCDGMSPNGVTNANTPNMHRLMKEGSYSLHARGVMPTSSSPNWASMIMGAGPEQHGITSNDWETNKFEIPPVAVGSGGIFPTIFGVLREQRPASTIACFHDWDGFGRLFERAAANIIENPNGPTNTIREASEYLREQKPTFLFIHLDHVDGAGHKYGHGTPEYYAAVESADRLIGEVVKAAEDAGIWDDTVVIITADHGGKGKHHGGATLGEIEIPWIIRGPGIARDREIKTPINIYDTAPTVAMELGLTPPDCWIGRPVKEALATTSAK